VGVKLSIVIVSWNVRQHLLRCLASLFQHAPRCAFEVVVADNASSDGTVDAVREAFPEVTVSSNATNRGFAAANNQGIARSTGEYVLLLNPDTILHPGSLDSLIDFLEEHDDVGACGPKLLNPDGTLQPSVKAFPTFRGALHRYTAWKYARLFRPHGRRWRARDFDYTTTANVDQLMGAALVLRREALGTSAALDERFFMYFEEVDLCYRIKHAGWRIVYLPEAVVTHIGGSSSRQMPLKARLMALTSLRHFFRKHRGRWATFLFQLVFEPALLLRFGIQAVSTAVKRGFAVLRTDRAR